MIYVICNPTAGNGRSEKTGALIDKTLTGKNIEHEYLLTTAPGHATTLAAQAAQKGAEAVFAIGGDGTVLEVARGLLGTQTALGVIPAGTGNDFIKTIATPKDPLKALDAALQYSPRPTDAVRLNDRIFLNETGTGFDVMVLSYAAKAKKYCHGLLPYLYGVLCTIFHFSSVHVSYALDGGETVERDILVLGAGNGRYIGGGIPIAPDATPDDGLLDVVIVNGMKKTRMLSVLLPLLKGRILSFPETEFIRAKALTISGKGMRLNIDGEICPIERADISIMPGKLLVLRP